MTDTLLFPREKVKKFFEILSNRERHTCKRYMGYDKINPDYAPCAKEVFVKRTLHKWLKGKYLIIYRESEQTNVEYKQYVSITNVKYVLGWGEEIGVSLYDFTKPYNIWNSEKFSHNKALDLEGEWCESTDTHHELLKLTSTVDIPEKEYVFMAYDISKMPKRAKKGQTYEDKFKACQIPVPVKAKTLAAAYRAIKRVQKEKGSGDFIVTQNLIETKLWDGNTQKT